LVQAAAAVLPDLHPAVAIPLEPRGWDASADVPPDEAVDAAIRVLAAVPYAEKLAAQEPVVPASPAVALPAQSEVPGTRGAGRSAA